MSRYEALMDVKRICKVDLSKHEDSGPAVWLFVRSRRPEETRTVRIDLPLYRVCVCV